MGSTTSPERLTLQSITMDEFHQVRVHTVTLSGLECTTNWHSQPTTKARCTHCSALAGCLRALTVRIKRERAHHAARNEQYIHTSLHLHICRTSMQIQNQKLLAAFRRSEARCSRMNNLISQLVVENQKKDDLISCLREEIVLMKELICSDR